MALQLAYAEAVYFVRKRGRWVTGVARVLEDDRKLLDSYRNASDWREVSRETYLRARYQLCLV